MKVIIFITLFVITIGAVITASVKTEQSSEAQQQPRTLKLMAQRAKAKGEKQTSRRAPISEYVTDIRDIDEALIYYHVILAEPVEKKSFVRDERVIWTWYKFRIVENLSQRQIRPCSACPPPDGIPVELLPLNQDEILVAKNGGTVSIDGVDVIMTDPEFPDFETSQKYILFLEIEESGHLGLIRVGPGGSFIVDSKGSIAPLNDQSHSLKRLIKEDYKNSVHELKRDIQNRKPRR